MPAAKPTPQPRRPIRRFELQDVRFNDRASHYKDPQLVLKPQLDLVPRKPADGSRLRMPLWRHYLMVHVKDRAEELVKLDLADFRQSEEPTSTAPERFIRRAHHEPVLYVRYPTNTQDGFSTLRATLNVASDFESVIKELGDLGIHIEYHQEELRSDQVYSWSQSQSQQQSGYYHPTPSAIPGSMPTSIPSHPYSPPYPATPNPPHPYSSSPPFPATASPAYQYSNTIGLLNQSTYQRSASQPAGYPGGYQSQTQWPPPVIPSPAETTIGIPGVLGAGIYKVSKLGSSSSSRSRSRKSQTSRGLHDSGGADRGKYLENSPLTTQSSSSKRSSQDSPLNLAQSGSSQRRGLQRVQTVYSDSQETMSQASTLVPDSYDPSSRPFGGLRIPEEEETGDVPSQQTTITTAASRERATTTTMTASQPSTSTEMVPYKPPQQNNVAQAHRKINTDALLHISQIQQEGLFDAARVWDDIMEKGRNAIVGVKGPEEAFRVLSGYREEFTKRWDRVVASTVREMKEVENKDAI
ncbi:hypothetical protein QBC36DRAFT_358315 [Triangularia setosa]|uniref:Uncharacterized protein n=1 Tax=Triangularia setosa TaxID=2587417 RepID=A0AAN6WGN0_9PEZI|nr:hypothetical protein QBC36DRAFT_358315 [Podospora setosa]